VPALWPGAQANAQASTLGIPDTRYSPYARGAPRGRARGRGRGRGGANFPPRPMRLDNRSRTIALSGDALSTDESKTALREWYESTGGNVSIESSSMLITYPNREMAEKVSPG
jgi:RNA-binding protein 26